MNNVLLKPLFKYPGGKSSEFKHLKKLFPEFDTYIEPFLGGGAVYWGTEASKWIVNDCSDELILVYKFCQKQDHLFLQYLKDIGEIWLEKNLHSTEIIKFLSPDFQNSYDLVAKTLSNSFITTTSVLPIDIEQLTSFILESIERKQKSLRNIGKSVEISNWLENALGAMGAGIYTYLRNLYNCTSINDNPQLKVSLYLFLREYAYSSMFRFNSKGEFNVPFGGNTYAKKDFLIRYKQITDEAVVNKLKNTKILQGDFSKAFIDEDSSFMFLDPPYDSEFSTYNLQVFDFKEQIRLRNELKKIKKTKWLMVVKSTDFIEELYEEDGWYKFRFDKSYSVNFKNRNDKNVNHLVITNYKLGDK